MTLQKKKKKGKATYLWSNFSHISNVPFLSLQAENIKQRGG